MCTCVLASCCMSFETFFKRKSKITIVAGYWLPVVWGWLPDKAELSYKVLILMVQQKCEELGWKLDVSSVISDFELNIMKSIDEMLDADILGCFFHLKKIFKEKVDKKGFKSRYEKDMKFRKFINECSYNAHLPEELLEVAVDHLDKKYVFEDEKTKRFKEYFIQYIKDYWINGCYPPRTWNCWS